MTTAPGIETHPYVTASYGYGSTSFQGPVVPWVDNIIQRKNPYPTNNIGAFLILIGHRANFINWIEIYLLDKVIDSSIQPGPDNKIKNFWQGLIIPYLERINARKS